jgi:predicted dehydrogenase
MANPTGVGQAMTIRWGLIGCGDIARKRVAPALRDILNSELVSVSRARFDQAEQFAKEFGAHRWYADWKELIADEEIDAVYIATPVHLHAAQAIAAAQAGKHVLCEKPMAMTVAECDEMIAACSGNAVRLGVAYYRHFYPVIDRIRSIVASGAIGKPILAQVNAFEWFDPPASHPRHWLLEAKLSGGGPMFDFGCHRIEVLINLFGKIKQVKSLVGRLLFDREVEDTATALFEFGDGPQAIISVTHAARGPQDTLEIFGSQGSIHVPVLNDGAIKISTQNDERTERHPPHANLHLPLIEDFVQAILSNRNPRVDGHVGREVARIEEMIYADHAHFRAART